LFENRSVLGSAISVHQDLSARADAAE
jgi:hypothetical protein